MAIVGNWTIEACATVGQGVLILAGSDVGFARFLDSIPTGEVWYSITDGTNREAGKGTFNGATQISRDTVYATLVNNVYNNVNPTPISLSGNAIVACTFNTAAYDELIAHVTDTTNPHAVVAQQVFYDSSSDPVSGASLVQTAMIDHAESIEERVSSMSGIILGGVISSGSPTQFSVADGNGTIYDSYTTPNNTTVTSVAWLNLNNITLQTNGTAGRTVILITTAGNVLQVVDTLTGVHYRENIILGAIYYINNVITDIANAPSVVKQTATDLYDLMLHDTSISGSETKPVTAALSIWVDAGLLFYPGVNWYTDIRNPNTFLLPQVGSSVVPANINPMTVTGLIGTEDPLIPQFYNSAADTLVPLAANQATIHRLYNLGAGSRDFVLLYGQNLYSTLNEARDNLEFDRGNTTFPVELNNLYLLAEIGIDAGAVDMDDNNTSFIVNNQALTSSSAGGATNDHTTLTNRDANDQHPIGAVASLQPALDARMVWKDIWVAGTYEANDVARDGAWTMVANVQTEERPAPQASGEPFNIYDGTLDPQQSSSKTVTFGTRYSALSTAWIISYRVDVTAGQHYVVIFVSDPLGTPVFTLLADITATSTGFVTLNVPAYLIGNGVVFDIIAQTNEPDPSPTISTFNYNYTTPQNASAPATGDIVHAGNSAGIMNINKTDSDAGNNAAFLEGLTPGDIISGLGIDWIIQSSTDLTTYIAFGVSPAVQGSPTGISPFDFETVSATPIDYGDDVNYNLGNANVRGLFIIDGDYSSIVPDDNQYGVDIEVQPASVSDDWDLLATSDSGTDSGKVDSVSGTATDLTIKGTLFAGDVADEGQFLIRKADAIGSLAVSGGTNSFDGAALELYGDSQSVNPGDIYMLSGGDVLFQWDEVDGQLILFVGSGGAKTEMAVLSATGLAVEGVVSDIGGNVRDGRRNALINGNLDIWQRGTDFPISTTTATSIMDMFRLDRGNSATGTVTASQVDISTDIGWGKTQPQYGCRLLATGLTGSSVQTRFRNRVEGVETFSGQTVTVSFYIQNDGQELDTARTIVRQNFGTGGSPSGITTVFDTFTVPLGRSYHQTTLSVPSLDGKTIGTDGNDYLEVIVYEDGNVEFTESDVTIAAMQVEVGVAATALEYTPRAETLALCQRYYIFDDTFRFIAFPIYNSTTDFSRKVNIDFPTTMRAAPTISGLTFNGGWSGSPTSSAIAPSGFVASGTATGAVVPTTLYAYTADASL